MPNGSSRPLLVLADHRGESSAVYPSQPGIGRNVGADEICSPPGTPEVVPFTDVSPVLVAPEIVPAGGTHGIPTPRVSFTRHLVMN
jgi:hypothetical protein